MSNVLTFAPRPAVAVPVEPAPIGDAEIRTRLGEALQTALDAVDHIIAVLDYMDGEPNAEDGGEAGPTLADPENSHGGQVVWPRGNDGARDAEAPEILLPIAVADRVVVPLTPLPWGGSGDVVAAAGVALLNMGAGCRC